MGRVIDFNPRSHTGRYAVIEKNIADGRTTFKYWVYKAKAGWRGAVVDIGEVPSESELKSYLWQAHGILYLTSRTYLNFLDWYERITGRELLPPDEDFIWDHVRVSGTQFAKE